MKQLFNFNCNLFHSFVFCVRALFKSQVINRCTWASGCPQESYTLPAGLF